jgi:dipeptidase E
MKIFLTSNGIAEEKIAQKFLEVLGKDPASARVVIITNAENIEELFFAKNGPEKTLRDLGVKRVKIFNLDDPLHEEGFDKYDAVYVAGGNTFSILNKMRSHAVDLWLKEFVENGGLYVGESAGSIIAGPDIKIAGYGSEGDENRVGLRDHEGLGFTHKTTFPHYKDELEEEVDEWIRNAEQPVYVLRDGEAVFIDEDGQVCL